MDDLTLGKAIAVAVVGVILYLAWKAFNSVVNLLPTALKGILGQLQKALDIRIFKAVNTNVKIVVVDTAYGWEDIKAELLSHCHDFKVLGFDCEWVTRKSKTGPVALIQLATYQGLCVLIRTSKLKYIPLTLKDLLEDDSILKVGVNSVVDGSNIYRDFGVFVQGCLDLRHLVLQHPRSVFLKGKLGLKSLAGSILQYEMEKMPFIAGSNWENDTLTSRQIYYAAEDALVGISIFIRLLLDIICKKWLFFSIILSRSAIEKEIRMFCNGKVDIHYKPNRAMIKNCNVQLESSGTSQYHVCLIQAPDGKHLCTCDDTKANWYAALDFGEIIQQEPMILRLNFQPESLDDIQ